MMLDALCVCAQARLRACVFVRARLQYGGLSSPPRVHVQCVCVCVCVTCVPVPMPMPMPVCGRGRGRGRRCVVWFGVASGVSGSRRVYPTSVHMALLSFRPAVIHVP